MSKYKATNENTIITDNVIHQRKEYGTIQMINIGDCDAVINDNIPLLPGDSWEWVNHPSVMIDQDTNVRFTGDGVDKRILVEMITYKEG